MPYRSTDKTRKKKDSKRTAMMQAAVRVFAERGYHDATVRDIVSAADVAVGTFYFYFPDKETLFVHLYEETADFLIRTIRQAVVNRATLPQQLAMGLQAYVNIAVYEPAVVQLLLVGGVGAVLSLIEKRAVFRENLIAMWQAPLEQAMQKGVIAPQNLRRTAEALAGAFDEVVLNLLGHPNPEAEAGTAVQEMTQFALRAVVYKG
ncbi:MAG: TetR/AcrR family transcriptional regulator [Ardenticatenaceae bacterium]|nr:TetR/AcrR family transcriptional regulator [Anaerolineales bacterium]MCB8921481.1 TetR/AcrR family transcriptional regulator [Ardenticatenaceae bacterium]MCB8990888.1 TetR/AcrR family transcriptional regulator [Ardenticatenaceae bacterium]MCB9004955.1 TetR/AcrR family transcriptional regulator [Ardenticatenaceae bacterium]